MAEDLRADGAGDEIELMRTCSSPSGTVGSAIRVPGVSPPAEVVSALRACRRTSKRISDLWVMTSSPEFGPWRRALKPFDISDPHFLALTEPIVIRPDQGARWCEDAGQCGRIGSSRSLRFQEFSRFHQIPPEISGADVALKMGLTDRTSAHDGRAFTHITRPPSLTDSQ